MLPLRAAAERGEPAAAASSVRDRDLYCSSSGKVAALEAAAFAGEPARPGDWEPGRGRGGDTGSVGAGWDGGGGSIDGAVMSMEPRREMCTLGCIFV